MDIDMCCHLAATSPDSALRDRTCSAESVLHEPLRRVFPQPSKVRKYEFQSDWMDECLKRKQTTNHYKEERQKSKAPNHKMTNA